MRDSLTGCNADIDSNIVAIWAVASLDQSFRDLNQLAPTHVLVIPKGPYVNFDHFAAEASDAEVTDFTRTIGRVCRETGAAEAAGGNGFRAISNAGPDGVQEVPHFHLHVLAGRVLGPMVKRAPS